jgi:hypothetical protein
MKLPGNGGATPLRARNTMPDAGRYLPDRYNQGSRFRENKVDDCANP